MSKTYKYDVAISFAEEDKAIAEQIALSLKKVNLIPYFYEFESAENWGENIFNIIINRYREQARFALILISQHYVRKRWASIELQVIQAVSQREEKNYLIPLRIDDTPVEGLSSNALFKRWSNNPDELAEDLKQKIAEASREKTQKENPEARTGGGEVNNTFNTDTLHGGVNQYYKF